jgi:hypothetical protein
MIEARGRVMIASVESATGDRREPKVRRAIPFIPLTGPEATSDQH